MTWRLLTKSSPLGKGGLPFFLIIKGGLPLRPMKVGMLCWIKSIRAVTRVGHQIYFFVRAYSVSDFGGFFKDTWRSEVILPNSL